MHRVTNQARAVAAAAAAKYTQPQLSSFAKPSSLDVLSDSAASQVLLLILPMRVSDGFHTS